MNSLIIPFILEAYRYFFLLHTSASFYLTSPSLLSPLLSEHLWFLDFLSMLMAVVLIVTLSLAELTLSLISLSPRITYFPHLLFCY